MMQQCFSLGSMPLRRAAIAALASFGMLAPVTGHGDTGQLVAGYGGLVETLDFERTRLDSYASRPAFDRVARLPAGDVTIDPPEGATSTRAREWIAALGLEDKAARAEADGARTHAITELLVTDTGGVMDLSAIRRVTVGSKSAEWRCLTEALYFEARGESLVGQVAVAEVILNRADSASFPDTVCGVISEGTGSGRGCQFSYKCDGRKEVFSEKRAYELVGKVAWVMLQGKPRILTGKATFYHTTSVRPNWSRIFVRTARIGYHVFYRRPVRVSSR